MKRATKIPKSPRGLLGNLVKNVSPFLALTPVGALGAGIAGGVGEVIRNKKASLKDIAKAGLSNATLGKGLDKGVGMLRARVGGSSAAALPAAPGAAPLPTDPLALEPISAGAGAPASVLTPGAEAALDGASKTGTLRNVVGWAAKNPTAAGMGLQALGSLSTAGSENRMNEANANLLEQRYVEGEDERRRRAAMDAFLSNAPLSLERTVAPNPYLG